MIKLPQPTIVNSKGEPVVLNAAEKYHADYMQRMVNERFANALGYEVPITTLTTIMKLISEQKFFQLPPADYVPVNVGEGAWSTTLTTYRSFNLADDFASGIINTGASNTRLAVGDAGVDAVNVAVGNWAKAIGWTIFDLEQAAKSGNWDLVSAKEKSRKENWDLGIQKIAFLGLKNNSSFLGLFTQSGITTNTSVITKAISTMNTTELKTLCATIIEAYRSNCNRTAWPTHFVVPESDYNGLASQSSADFPIKSVLQILEETFQVITKNKSFQILPCAYGDLAYNAGYVNGSTGAQIYSLHRYDEESIRMNIPVDYTNTLANSIDNFAFQNTGYGQFTGVMSYRPLEQLYFQY